MPSEASELAWLGCEPLPPWGGHLERDEPISDAQMRGWVERGLIEAVDKPCKGYVLTEHGRQFVRNQMNDHRSTLERASEIERDFYHLKAQEWACEPHEAEDRILSALALVRDYFKARRCWTQSE